MERRVEHFGLFIGKLSEPDPTTSLEGEDKILGRKWKIYQPSSINTALPKDIPYTNFFIHAAEKETCTI